MNHQIKRLLTLLAGAAALLLLYLIDEWLFSRWLGIHYWKWYLKNGALIGFISAIVLKIWGNGADKHLGLISSHPLHYLRSWLGFIGLPVYSLGTQLRRNQDISLSRSLIDSVLALVWALVLVPVLLAWFIVIVPLQFLIYFVCGGPVRYALDSDRLALARFAPLLDGGTRLVVDEADKYSSPLLRLRDLKDARGLIRKLLGADDSLSAWLREQLSTGLIEELGKEKDSKEMDGSLIQRFLNELNPLLEGKSIYDEKRFYGVILTEKVRKSVDPSEQVEKKVRLNRSLLEEAYPDEIEPSITEERFDSWWDASLSRNPVSMTNALGALLMFGLQKIAS